MGYSGNFNQGENKENVGLIIFILVAGFLLVSLIFAGAVAISMRASVRRLEGTQTARVATRVAKQTATAEYCSSLASGKDYPTYIIFDQFNKNRYGWSIGPWDDEYVISSEQIIGGVYRIEAEAKQNFIGWRYPKIGYVNDFYLEVDAGLVEGSVGAEYGVVFRAKSSNYYTFEIEGDGRYWIALSYEDDWTTFKRGRVALHKEGMNKIVVLAKGDRFCFFVNDHFVAEIEDDRIPSGKMGIIYGLDEEGDKGVFEFDNFELRVPQKD